MYLTCIVFIGTVHENLVCSEAEMDVGEVISEEEDIFEEDIGTNEQSANSHYVVEPTLSDAQETKLVSDFMSSECGCHLWNGKS